MKAKKKKKHKASKITKRIFRQIVDECPPFNIYGDIIEKWQKSNDSLNEFLKKL